MVGLHAFTVVVPPAPAVGAISAPGIVIFPTATWLFCLLLQFPACSFFGCFTCCYLVVLPAPSVCFLLAPSVVVLPAVIVVVLPATAVSVLPAV